MEEKFGKAMLLKVLGSDTRRKILRLLMKKEMHVSGISKELNIAKPVAARHVKMLEKCGLIERKKFGNVHLLHVKKELLYSLLDEFSEEHEIKLKKGETVLDALKKVAGVNVRRINDKEFIVAIDGEEGYYIYEVNGMLPDKPMSEYKIKGDVNVEIKKIHAIRKKLLKIKLNEKNQKS